MIKFQKITSNLHLVSTDTVTPWKCNGLVVKPDNGDAIWIDCNYKSDELDQLIEFSGMPERYFITHVHMDHVNNVHNIESLGIPVYCPELEVKYIINGKLLMEHSGASLYNVLEPMKSFLFTTAGFKNLKKVTPYGIKEKFIFDNIGLEAINLPGHSPGHTGFVIRDLTGDQRPVLFTSDIGLEKIGAWYGFEYCDVGDIKKSAEKMEKLYGSEDFILTGSHTDLFFEKQNGLIKEVVSKIEESKRNLISLMDNKESFSPDDFVFKGVYYKTSSIEKMHELTKKLYFFWEGYSIRNLFDDLEKDGSIKRLADDQWSLNVDIATDFSKKVV
jgi:glyoxylase-like metal-dependent hydrolase (beta-lactamase superfamily II)